jgi:2-hydroxy-4-carboxymuconate semialdehyde hemiacetal dehydrogenase
MKDDAVVNVLMVGSGSIAGFHSRAIRELGHTPYHVVGRRETQVAEFAAEAGFARHGIDLERALDDPAVDVVVITSPSDFHRAHAEAALARKLPTLLEIPVATSLADAEAVGRAASAADTPVMAAHTRRFQPAMLHMRAMVAEGSLSVHQAVQRYGFIRRLNVNWVGYQRSWTDNLIWHHGGHAMDAWMWVLGVTEVEVSAKLGPPHHHLEIPMDIAIALKTANGQVGSISLSYNTHQPLDDALYIGEEDTITANYATGTLVGKDGVIFDAGMTEVVPHDVITAQDREFFAAVDEQREPNPTVSDVLPSLRALQVVQDIYSAEYGK